MSKKKPIPSLEKKIADLLFCEFLEGDEEEGTPEYAADEERCMATAREVLDLVKEANHEA